MTFEPFPERLRKKLETDGLLPGLTTDELLASIDKVGVKRAETKEALLLREQSNLTFREIGERLGITPRKARAAYTLGLSELRWAISDARTGDDEDAYLPF